MEITSDLDRLFAEAVHAIDHGELPALRRLLNDHPELVSHRLESPGAWLRQSVGDALNGFFANPHLLWFVAEDPVRTGRLPSNIADVTRVIIDAARRHAPESLQSQLDHTLQLVSWSGVAAASGVQLPLIDILVEAGATPGGNADSALVNRHVAAAERLIQLGGSLSLGAALCLDRGDHIPRLFAEATADERQFSLVLAALNGKSEGVRWMLEAGVPPNQPSADLYPHGMPLHHAVCSGSLSTVKALVEAGADVGIADTAWDASPLAWAEHYVSESAGDRRARYEAIVEYLRRV